MSLLDFARGPALQFAFAVFVFGVLWRLGWLLFLPGASDKSVARPGAPSAFTAAVRGFAHHMWLPGKLTQSSMFSLVNGYVFHIGLAIIVFGFGPHILVHVTSILIIQVKLISCHSWIRRVFIKIEQ